MTLRRIVGYVVVATVAATGLALTASATNRQDNVDTFTVARGYLKTEGYAFVEPFWGGSWTWGGNTIPQNVRYEFVGAHDGDDAENVVMNGVFDITDDSSSQCINGTLNLARDRRTGVTVGGSCDSGSFYAYQGSVSVTKNSCVWPTSDTYHSHRNLPTFNFSYDDGATSTRSYKVTSTLTYNDPSSPQQEEGCFRIKWF